MFIYIYICGCLERAVKQMTYALDDHSCANFRKAHRVIRRNMILSMLLSTISQEV